MRQGKANYSMDTVQDVWDELTAVIEGTAQSDYGATGGIEVARRATYTHSTQRDESYPLQQAAMIVASIKTGEVLLIAGEHV